MPEYPSNLCQEAAMMDGGGAMMWGMGWVGLLIGALVILGIAALIKYLFFNDRS